jgi:hypothetical protein
MTLEETTDAILAAAEAADIEALEEARRLRETAMVALGSNPPSPELCSSIKASIAAGEEAKRAILAIKQRIRGESRRLATIESGFVRELQPAVGPHIDCKG